MDTGLFPVLSYYEYDSYEHTYIDFFCGNCFISLGQHLEKNFVPQDRCSLNFIRNFQHISQILVPSFHSPKQYRKIPIIPHPCLHLVMSVFLNLAIEWIAIHRNSYEMTKWTQILIVVHSGLQSVPTTFVVYSNITSFALIISPLIVARAMEQTVPKQIKYIIF